MSFYFRNPDNDIADISFTDTNDVFRRPRRDSCCNLPVPRPVIIRGARGPIGPRGPAGPAFSAAHGTFYNIFTATVLTGNNVPITLSGGMPLAMILNSVTFEVILQSPGEYLLDYTVYTAGTATVAAFMDSQIIPGSVVTSGDILHAEVSFFVPFAPQRVFLRNLAGTFNLAAEASGSSNVVLSITRISNA